MIDNSSVIVISDNLTVADLDGEAVILDQNEGMYYGLNEVGAYMLKLVEQPRIVQEIIDIMIDEYDVEVERLRSDVFAFLEEMHDNGLVRIMDEIPV